MVTPDPGGWEMDWNGGDTTVSLTHSPFHGWEDYTFTILVADDMAGNPLDGALYAWSFSVPPYSVSLPIVLQPVP